jgi:hypothetical protein
MRALSVKALALVIAIAIGSASCKKQSAGEKLKPTGTAAVAALEPSKDAKLLADLFKTAAPRSQFFTIQSKDRSTITTQNGTRYLIPALAFRRKDGSLPTGPVSVTIKEVMSAKDFVLSDRPTANAGDYLVSYGEFFVRATEAGADLKLVTPITVQVVPKTDNRPQRVPMWEGDTVVFVTVNGYDYQNQAVTVTQPVAQNPGVDWTQSSGYALFNSTTGTLDFQLSDLLTWRNCDAFNSAGGPRTTVLGYFNVFNDDTPDSSPEQPSMLFFKPKNINSVIKFFTLILNAPAGYKGFLSYQDIVPIGQEGTFLAITALNGQFYAELKDVVIGAPAPGTNYHPVNFDLQPVSGADVLAMIAELNNR